MCDNCSAGNAKQNNFQKLDAMFDEFSDPKGSLITVLQKAQDIYGYLSKDTIEYIAKAIGVSAAKIFGVATFYSQFRLKPIGKYMILLCKGTACHVNGADAIEDEVSRFLNIHDGETTQDGLFTMNNVACLGCCSLAPVMMIRGAEGEEAYGGLTRERVRAILNDIITQNGAAELKETGK